MKRTSYVGFFGLVISFMLMLSGCEDTFTPKPLGYFRIDVPEHKYISYDPSHCPFSFELDHMALIDTNVSDQHPCWFNLAYPEYNAVLHVSYSKISEATLPERIDDMYSLVMKHTVRANDITDQYFTIPNRDVHGIKYDFIGGTATSYQFFLTDSSDHFLRAALYFNNRPNPDSVLPMKQYITEDIEHMISSFRWKE